MLARGNAKDLGRGTAIRQWLGTAVLWRNCAPWYSRQRLQAYATLLNSFFVAEWVDVGVVAILTDPHMILAKCCHLRGMGDTKHLGMRSKIAQDPSNGIRCCAADADIGLIQYEAG